MSKQFKYAWYIRILFWLQKRKYGKVLKSAKIWAKSPKIFLALSWFYGMLDRKSSPISPVLRSLVIVRISQLNSCSFCIDLNTSVLLSRGVSVEKAMALQNWESSELFTDLEKAVIEYAEAISDSSKKIKKELQGKIKGLFSEAELVELTALIAFQNMSTKFNNAFSIEPQGFCTLDTKII